MTIPMLAVEEVLVVPRALFDELGAFEGLSFEADRYLHALLDPRHGRFLPRPAAENDPGFKQLIPYVLLAHGGRVLHYVRGKKGGEARLASKGSVGIGGHVNRTYHPAGPPDAAAFARGVRRELREEIVFAGNPEPRAAALLNDDSTEVGRVHLGVVYVLDLVDPAVASGESEITRLEWCEPSELRARRSAMESWSQICVDHLDRLLAG